MGGIVASSNCTSTAGPEILITLPMFSAIFSAFLLLSFQLSAFSFQFLLPLVLHQLFSQEHFTAKKQKAEG
jgi:hypothetical protein